MGTNSIKSNLDTLDLLSELRLFLSSDIEKTKIAIVIEGDEDYRFLNKFLTDTTAIFHSYFGKPGIVEAIEKCPNVNVIGIVDKDYEDSKDIDRIFYYDYCCLEMMIIGCNDVFISVLSEFGKQKDLSIRHYLLNELKLLSLLRKHNTTNKTGINFKGISIDKAYNKRQRRIEYSKLIKDLERSNKMYFSQNPNLINTVSAESDTIGNNLANLLDITQGHDFMSLFASFCKPEKGHITGAKDISASFRCAYRLDDFYASSLCGRLIEYQRLVGIEIITDINPSDLRVCMPVQYISPHPSDSAPARADSPHNTSSC